MTAPFLCGRVEKDGGRWEGGKTISGAVLLKGGRKRLERRSATKIKFWFWDILERQANFGRGSRGLGRGGVKRRRRVKRKKYAAPLKKYYAAT